MRTYNRKYFQVQRQRKNHDFFSRERKSGKKNLAPDSRCAKVVPGHMTVAAAAAAAAAAAPQAASIASSILSNFSACLTVRGRRR